MWFQQWPFKQAIRAYERLVWRSSESLSTFERRCLEETRRILAPSAQQILDAQLADVGWIQRWSRSVIFYFKEASAPPRMIRTSDFTLARLVLDRPKTWAEVTFSDGRLSTLNLSHLEGEIQDVGIASVRLLQDPMKGDRVLSTTPARVASIAPSAAEVLAPAPDATRAAFFERLPSVPPELVSLVSETDGFTAGQWSFLGTRARRALLGDEFVWFLAEDAEATNAIGIGTEGSLVRVREGDVEIINSELDASLRAAMQGSPAPEGGPNR